MERFALNRSRTDKASNNTLADAEPREPSLFDQAARVFGGWTDPDTGLRVLRVHTRGQSEGDEHWSTIYHQYQCFLDHGRKVLLCRQGSPVNGVPRSAILLDLTTGAIEYPFPPGYEVGEVNDDTQCATLGREEEDGFRTLIWDLRAGCELACVHSQGWSWNSINLLSDGQRAIVFHYRGIPYNEPVQSRHTLLTPGEPPRLLFQTDGYFCSHVLSCPGNPELYAHDHWPSPARNIDQTIHLRTLDGTLAEPLRMTRDTLRPGNMWGARDHFVWTPDSRHIVSYLCPHPFAVPAPDFNHFKFEWWLSVTDWRTGEDLAARYPAGRWGGHMQISPDSRHIVCGGGPGFDKLFIIDREGLRAGWNEQILCSYPKTTSLGKNDDPFPYPFVLPDQSGVIFNAGWPGPDHGVYLAEWPARGMN